MVELDSARDSLMILCTPGGQDALRLEVGQLHDLCATSEQELRERLAACEGRLEELDGRLAERAQAVKERAAALQWELRSLDQALSYSEPQNNITQLQQRWQSLQVTFSVCEARACQPWRLWLIQQVAALTQRLLPLELCQVPRRFARQSSGALPGSYSDTCW